jgi:hypothetical protein
VEYDDNRQLFYSRRISGSRKSFGEIGDQWVSAI